MAAKRLEPSFGVARGIPAAREWQIQLLHSVASRGITPVELMVAAMREYWEEAERYREATDMAIALGDEDAAVEYQDIKLKAVMQASAIAEKVAPYLHPRLNTMVANLDTSPFVVELKRFSERATPVPEQTNEDAPCG